LNRTLTLRCNFNVTARRFTGISIGDAINATDRLLNGGTRTGFTCPCLASLTKGTIDILRTAITVNFIGAI
jgi:hypothetical protein